MSLLGIFGPLLHSAPIGARDGVNPCSFSVTGDKGREERDSFWRGEEGTEAESGVHLGAPSLMPKPGHHSASCVRRLRTWMTPFLIWRIPARLSR